MNVIPFGLLLKAIEETETGHLKVKDRGHAIGDQGRSIGPMQIMRAAWHDAMDVMSWWGPENLKNRYRPPYRLARNQPFAQIIFYLYMKRYARDCLKTMTITDCVKMARIWNGGPRGFKKDSTKEYAEKFLWNLERGMAIFPPYSYESYMKEINELKSELQ